MGADHSERLAEIAKQKAEVKAQLATLQEKWHTARDLVVKIRELRTKLEGTGLAVGASAAGQASRAGAPTPARRETEIGNYKANWTGLQGENPLMRVCVDAQIISEVISGWTGIPVGKLLKDEISTVLELESHLRRRLIGQDHALQIIAERVRTSRSSLDDPSKPIGVFMLVGPSGVGKTETALIPGGFAIWRGAQLDYHQHVGISGSAHYFHAQGFAARVCRLRRRWCFDGSRPPPALFGSPAG